MIKKPAVTQLIALLDKPALLRWANQIGLQGIELDKYRKQSMPTGTDLHNQIKENIQNKIPFKDIQIQQNWDKFIADKQVIASEKDIETEWYKGRLDIKLFYNGYTYICDFKSQSAVYLETILQLTAYRLAGNHSEFTKIAVIEIPSFRLIPIEIHNFEPYEEILRSLYSIYKCKQQIQVIK